MYNRIFVAFDGSSCSGRALEESLKLAKDQHAVLRAVHVLDESPFYSYPAPRIDVAPLLQAWREAGQDVLQQAVEMAQKEGLSIETELLETHGQGIADIVLEAANNWFAELLVVGTHGRHGVEHVLVGSVAENVVRKTNLPVLVIRGS